MVQRIFSTSNDAAGQVKGEMINSSNSSRLYRRVADELANAIRAGNYLPGEKFPGERELAEKFGVSRPTIREAMIALEIYGVVEIRHGSGIYVAQPQAQPEPTESTSGPQDLNVGAFELIEARIIIESGTAAVAAAVITPEDIAYLEDCVKRMAVEDEDEAEEADYQFHARIAAVTNNGPLIDVVESLWQLRTSSLLASNIMQQARGGGIPARLAEHGDILDALSRNDPIGAKAAMQKHLENVRQYLLDATEIEEMESLRNRQIAARAAMTVRSVY
ncbi:hypothetical protein AEAC466_12005 [Asticcacaulis sp. AC466]|uniref:FadR/GntR family transcriptional regulator n=1 Tax=Asticcacaulis sp. AC466 TaxID=1282362 RepID=UPI0003C3C287|nr:FadR/GntR family transcriptional regulator [Asticcacaulis sp. AC466]ESQ83724.1 hypothetical protein AEAC466_12005 [Asticcacaulis sp. AC466]